MKKIILIIILIILIGGGTFYGGMKYGQSKVSTSVNSTNFQNLSVEQQQLIQKTGENQKLRQGEIGLLDGEIILKDKESITIKMNDDSSKIIFYSEVTKIKNVAEGSINDIKVGESIAINGSQNTDGSYTAKIIQINSK
ncbi:MAG: hypothetical protein KAS12_02940 [Candidatus Aenigmarchaeota archaeon]|nr:hypothetical protein [Candidatus Aenigmarchaeota archaeon]